MSKTERRQYRAPALEKGLEILELLAEVRDPLATAEIATRLGRSKSEIFRMLTVLEDRGYIAKPERADGFVLTTRLFELAMKNPPTGRLLEAALPVMETLADAAEQSCHLAIRSREDMVVIARIESPGEVGFAVRVGHRRPLVDSTSGRVLLTFQAEASRTAWLARLRERLQFDETELEKDLEKITEVGYRRAESSFAVGIVDIGFPVFDGVSSSAIAALTIPYMNRSDAKYTEAEVTELARRAAKAISEAMRVGGARRAPLSNRRAEDH